MQRSGADATREEGHSRLKQPKGGLQFPEIYFQTQSTYSGFPEGAQ
jgi:hypothetical protein